MPGVRLCHYSAEAEAVARVVRKEFGLVVGRRAVVLWRTMYVRVRVWPCCDRISQAVTESRS